jgi:transcriptional regulator with XRE-family HTH domain
VDDVVEFRYERYGLSIDELIKRLREEMDKGIGLPPKITYHECPSPRRFMDLWTRGVPIKKIAKEFGVSEHPIAKWTRKLTLPRRRVRIDREAFRRDCEAGLTPARLAERYKISPLYASRLRRAMGFPPLHASSRPLAKVVEVAQLDGITYGKTEKQKRMEEIGRRLAELKEFGRRWDHQNVFNCPSSQNKWTWSDWLDHARYGLLDDVPKDIVDTIKEYISLERELLGLQEMRRKKPLEFVRILKMKPLEGQRNQDSHMMPNSNTPPKDTIPN